MVETQSAEVWCQEGAARDYAVIVVTLCVMPSSAFLGGLSASAVALFASCVSPVRLCSTAHAWLCPRGSIIGVLLSIAKKKLKKKL